MLFAIKMAEKSLFDITARGFPGAVSGLTASEMDNLTCFLHQVQCFNYVAQAEFFLAFISSLEPHVWSPLFILVYKASSLTCFSTEGVTLMIICCPKLGFHSELRCQMYAIIFADAQTGLF